MKKLAMALAAASMTVTGTFALTAVPAEAHKKGKKHDHRRYYTSDNGVRYWQEDGRYRCRRSDGTVGLIVGGAGGALLGRAVDTRGERATGTILGAAAGALLGREVDQGRTISCR
jgi:outer membrane lipoprotein SlyB